MSALSARSDPERTLYLVDGSSLFYRAFHAIRGLTTPEGRPTNAIYGFTTMLRKLVNDLAPRYLAVALDRPEPTFRHAAYEDYKANREEMPEDLAVQVPFVKQVCRVLSVPTLELAGYEADDIIGTLAQRARAAGFAVVVVASDKDLLQLVDDGVRFYNPVSERLLDGAGVVQTFGVKPEQVPDVLALWGDASDNIPGVPGIGEKGAKDLVRRYGDLETVLREAGSVERKQYREGLLSHADTARLSRDLATIRRDAPIPFDLESLRLGPPDVVATRALFQELHFTGLLDDLAPPVRAAAGAHEIVLDVAHLDRAVTALEADTQVGINLERDDTSPMRGRLVGLTLAGESGKAWYVPLAHRGLGTPRQVPADEALRRIRPLLEAGSPRLVGHNVKSDLVLLHRLGRGAAAFAFDTMLASYLLNPERSSHSVETLGREIVALQVPAYADLLGSGAKSVVLDELPVDRAAPVLCARLAAVMALVAPLRGDLAREKLGALLDDLELPLAAVLAEMERTGVRVDAAFLTSLAQAWEEDLRRLTKEIHLLAGQEFNINSPQQTGKILFEDLKLTPGRRTQKTRSFSTSIEVLEDLAEDHELPRRILEYRTLQKLKSTYVDTLPGLILAETGRVHTSFNQAVAATGRLSSSDPNLQNIPIRSEQGRQIRRAFIPAEGHLLLSADYSQIELRVLAHLCGDAALVRAFQSGEDIHQRTAAEVFGVLPGLVTGEMRRRAKAVNFGILYGMGPQRLARDQGITLKESSEFIARYFGRFPGVKAYIDATIARAEEEGQVRTLFGRVRHFPEMKGADRNARQQAIRAAVNTTIQGTAADLIKMAMVRLDRRLRDAGSPARMTLQVHDELVLEVPAGQIGPVAAIVRDVMESVHPLAVPLTVDLRAGRNWLETEILPRSKD